MISLRPLLCIALSGAPAGAQDWSAGAVARAIELPAHEALMRSRADAETAPAPFETDGCSGGLSEVFCGCRPWCKKLLSRLACDRVRSSVRPSCAALSRAAGRHGDQRIGSKSEYRALCSQTFTGFPDPDLFDRCAHSGLRLLTLPLAPALVDYDMKVMPQPPAPDLCNPRSLSAWPKAAGPSCLPRQSRPASSAFVPTSLRATSPPRSCGVQASSAGTSRR